MPDETEPGIVALHLKRYEFARPYCVGKHVLDAGCGVGYGSAFLGEAARSVVGVDVSADAIEYARARYGGGNVEFAVGDLQQLERGDAEFDAVVAFEVIEHLPHPERFVAEARRVLKPDGVLVVSTPRADRGARPAGEPVPRARVRPGRVRATAPCVVRSRRRLRAATSADRTAPRAPATRRARPPPSTAVPPTRVEARHRYGADGRRLVRGRRDLARRSRRGDGAGRRLPPVRIVHLVIGGEIAGGQLVALQLARGARDRGDVVSFVSPADGPFAARCSRGGLRGRRRRRRADVPGRRPAAARSTAASRARRRPAHAHARGGERARASRRAARARAGRLAPPHREPLSPRDASRCSPVSTTPRRDSPQRSSRSRRTRAARTRNRATRTASASSTTASQPRPPTRTGFARSSSIPADAPLVAEVGRLCDVKGQRELIDAVARTPGRARRARRRRPRAGRRLRAGASAPGRRARRHRPRRVRRLPRRRRARRRGRGRLRAAVVDRGPAARRARGDGARTRGRRDDGRGHAGARRPTARPGCSCRRGTSRRSRPR